ncbi:flagellar export protein FliJ [Clostridium hydrogenum]|uniref:flagellar export protein FliJ n=1 Tax=Clostridium hydrogenum TaxID=2855764 RepID=UPI001F3AC74B|nr:flagellar export protein FliJ [Clostridium hydrogenum]
MERFNFRLQKLLDLKFEKEEEGKIVFKKAQDDKISVENKLENLKDSYSKYSQVRITGTVIEQKIMQNYLNAVSVCIDETSDELQTKTKVLEEKRQELIKKQIERKTVEALKEKQKQNFDKKQKIIEQNFNDELALYGYIRKREGR